MKNIKVSKNTKLLQKTFGLISPDFSNMDNNEPQYNNQKELRLNAKHSLFAKRANAMEMFILELLWDKKSLDFNTIAHKCMEKGVHTDSNIIAKTVRRMCRRKLTQLQEGRYIALVTKSNIEFRNFDMLVQTAYNGSPNKMVYTPPSTPTGFGGGE
jgi:Penicillinase repressor